MVSIPEQLRHVDCLRNADDALGEPQKSIGSCFAKMQTVIHVGHWAWEWGDEGIRQKVKSAGSVLKSSQLF